MTIAVNSQSDRVGGPSFLRHRGPVTSVAPIPFTGSLVTGAYDSAVALYDLQAGKVELVGYHRHLVNKVIVHPSGTLADDDPAWQRATWRPCVIDPPPEDWSGQLPGGVLPRDVWGFDPAGDIPESEAEGDHHLWIEFHVGNASLTVFQRDAGAEGAPVTHTPWVFVDDVDAHYEQSKASGITIVDELWQHGARAYTAADLEGNHWTFAQASPHMRR